MNRLLTVLLWSVLVWKLFPYSWPQKLAHGEVQHQTTLTTDIVNWQIPQQAQNEVLSLNWAPRIQLLAPSVAQPSSEDLPFAVQSSVVGSTRPTTEIKPESIDPIGQGQWSLGGTVAHKNATLEKKGTQDNILWKIGERKLGCILEEVSQTSIRYKCGDKNFERGVE